MSGCLATWWRQATEGTAYVRCELPARHLPGQCLDLTDDDGELAEDDDGEVYLTRQRGAAVWQFIGDARRALLAAQQQELGTRVLVEVDDNYLIPAPPVPGAQRAAWRPTIREAHGNGGYSNEAHRRIVSWVDGVIVSTPALETQYRKVNEHVYVCPNQVDPGDWPDPPVKPDDGVLRVGYAASASHWRDYPLLDRAFRWAAGQDGVEVHFMGIVPRDVDYPHVELGWLHSLAGYREALQALDVGCCPLVENPWSAGRSDLKALEYAMAGALPVVSRTEPYRSWWDGPAPVATSPKEFLDVVRRCVRDRDEVKRLAAESRRYVLDHRTVKENIWRWREAVEPG